jgi:intraflagellar transport protein 52
MDKLRIKLAQVTNKCSDDEIDYYIKECSDILGITGKIENKNDSKAILSYVFKQLVIRS